MSEERRQSIEEQALLVADIVDRCRMRDRGFAEEAMITLRREEIKRLEMLVERLNRMAPFEDKIRRVVTGK